MEQLEDPFPDPEVSHEPEVANDQSSLLQGIQALVHASRQPGILIQEVILLVTGGC